MTPVPTSQLTLNFEPSLPEYLAAKFMVGGDEARKARAVARVEQLANELSRAMATLKG